MGRLAAARDFGNVSLTECPSFSRPSCSLLLEFIFVKECGRSREIDNRCDQRSVGQSVLVSGSHLETMTRFLFSV
jgi:hypothetical protein